MQRDGLINILVVDDRPQNLEALEALLSAEDYNVVKAGSGEEALREVLRQDFAVILMDVQMPFLDGFDTARLIRSRKVSRKIPIIFVTAVDTEKRFIYQGYDAGAVDYMTKPLDPHILRSKVAVFVDLFRKNREIVRQSELIRENQQREHERQLERLELQNLRRYRNLADAIPHMVWRSDANGILNYCNQGWREYTAIACDAPGWTLWRRILHPDDLLPFLAGWGEAKKPAPAPFECVARIRRASDQSYRWHLIRVVPELEDGVLSAWLGTNTDIHDRKLAEETLLENSRELARSNSELEQFAYVASHDLQEPLRMVASYAQLLDRRFHGQFGESGDKFIAYIVDGAARMQALISDLLTYSRAGRGDLSFEEMDFNDALSLAIDDLKDMIRQSGAVITHDTLPKLRANPPRIGQLLQNLIGNAIKFRGELPPHIHVSAQLEGENWVFSVQDNGIGIEPQYFERIFVIFQRLHTREKYPGTGIGLAICKKIVERHHGTIWVESTEGHGSTFRFTIPARLPATGLEAHDMHLEKRMERTASHG